MNEETTELSRPDLTQGIEISTVPDGAMLLGHAHGEAVLLIRRGAKIFAIGATCTHDGAPPVDGLLVGDTVRCPWHHVLASPPGRRFALRHWTPCPVGTSNSGQGWFM